MALIKDRNTKSRLPGNWHYPVAAATKIYGGALVALSAAGYAAGGATATTLVAVGRAEEAVDNSGGAAGDKRVPVSRGVFLFANAVADPVVQADVGRDCFIVDDETVAHSSGANTRSVAGKVRAVEAGGVWVEI
jgi:hypothetical protein